MATVAKPLAKPARPVSGRAMAEAMEKARNLALLSLHLTLVDRLLHLDRRPDDLLLLSQPHQLGPFHRHRSGSALITTRISLPTTPISGSR